MIGEALSYPTDDEELLRPYLIGSALLLGTTVVGLTAIPLQGYYLRALDDGRTGDRGLPAFDDAEGLIVDGLKAMGVNLVYTGVPTLIFGVAVAIAFFGAVLGSASDQGTVTALLLVVAAVLGLLGLVLVLLGALMAPAAMARMRARGDFRAAFDVRSVFGVVTSSEYVIAVLAAYLIASAVGLISTLLIFVLVGFPLLFFGGLVTFHLYGQGYARATNQFDAA